MRSFILNVLRETVLIHLYTLYFVWAQTIHMACVKGYKSKEIKISLHSKEVVIKKNFYTGIICMF